MKRFACVLLYHETRDGSHYDWLLGDPNADWANARPFWTARVAYPSGFWWGLGVWLLWPIEPHRRHYLTYQGPLKPSGDRSRGQVRRADEGWIEPWIWTAPRIVARVWMRDFKGSVEIRQLSGGCYQAAHTYRRKVEP